MLSVGLCERESEGVLHSLAHRHLVFVLALPFFLGVEVEVRIGWCEEATRASIIPIPIFIPLSAQDCRSFFAFLGICDRHTAFFIVI